MRHVRFLTVLAIMAALLVLPATVMAAPAATAATTYTITDLGDLGGGFSVAYGINKQGQVVGVSATTVPDPQNPSITEDHGFLWQNGKMQDLGTPRTDAGTDPDSIANGINDMGQVVGAGHDYSYKDLHAFLWDKNSLFTVLPTLGGPRAFAYSLNASTQITGVADLKATDPSGGNQFHAVIWSASKPQDLGTLGGLDSAAGVGNSINMQGHVAGASNTTSSVHAFFWDGSHMLDLGALGQQTNNSVSEGEAVNDKDQVTGLSLTDVADSCFGGTQVWGFVWQGGAMQGLRPFSGDCDAFAVAINTGGQIVGFSDSGTPSAPVERAVIWSSGTAVDLNTLIPAQSGWSLIDAFGINDQGQIVGIGINPAGNPHGFLLTPGSSTTDPTAHRTQPPLTREQIKVLSRVLHSRYFGKLGGRLKI